MARPRRKLFFSELVFLLKRPFGWPRPWQPPMFADMVLPRIGYGYDIHRLSEGRKLILGGLEIPFERGLQGHSDADVVCHALTDAILGALALGDIGTHFPPSDPKWHNANSLHLLSEIWKLAQSRQSILGNADITVVAEEPRLAPYIEEMRGRLARCLDAPVNRVSIKATTKEGLGPEGRGEAISARAVCLLLMPGD